MPRGSRSKIQGGVSAYDVVRDEVSEFVVREGDVMLER